MDSWRELANTACEQSGLVVKSIEPLKTWDKEHAESAVYRLDGQWILKIYGPPLDWRFQTERTVLRTLEEYPDVPAPRIVSEGELPQGWPFLIMTAVPGGEMVDSWKSLTHPELHAVADQVGRIMYSFHHISQDSLASIENQPGMRNQNTVLQEETKRTADIIMATETLSIQQQDALLRFLHEDSPRILTNPPKITHFDLSHHHVYLAPEMEVWRVSGILDWADAVIGPPEWDFVCLWHWTFNGVWHPTYSPEWEMMQVCLRAYYADTRIPERFAQRCLAAHLLSPWMALLWPEFLERGKLTNDLVGDLTAFLFAPEVFGIPD